MKKLLKLFLLLLILAPIVCYGSRLTFFRDVVVTDPGAIVTDVRTYATLAAAVADIGATPSTLLITEDVTASSDLTIPATLTVKFINESVLTINATRTLTVNGFIEASPDKIFTYAAASSAVVWGTEQPLNIEWWGVSTSESAANNTTFGNYALVSAWDAGPLYVNGMYDLDGILTLVPGARWEKIIIWGRSRETGFKQTAHGVSVIELTAATINALPGGGVEVDIRRLVLDTDDDDGGDGLVLRTAYGKIEDVHAIKSWTGDLAKLNILPANTDIGFRIRGSLSLYMEDCSTDHYGTGFEIGSFETAGGTNHSTSVSTFTRLKAIWFSVAGILITGDQTKAGSNPPRGNTFISPWVETNDTVPDTVDIFGIHLKGSSYNNVLGAWVEGCDYAYYLERDSRGAPATPYGNSFVSTQISARVGSVGNFANIVAGENNSFTHGDAGAGTVILGTLAIANNFRFIRNLPQTELAVSPSSGTADTNTLNKLVNVGEDFVADGVQVGYRAFNTTDKIFGTVTAVDGPISLSLDADTFPLGTENYSIGAGFIDNGQGNTILALDDGGLADWVRYLSFMADSPYAGLTMASANADDAADAGEVALRFRRTQSGGERSHSGKISVLHDGAGDDQKGYMTFYTNDGTDADAPTERLRIDSVGAIIVAGDSVTVSTAQSPAAAAACTAGEIAWDADNIYVCVASGDWRRIGIATW